MALEKIDYIAMLADLKAKRTVLDASISGIEMALASGVLGQTVEGSSIHDGLFTPVARESVDLPVGAFLGKSVPAAIKLYLSVTKRKQTNAQIAAALKDGGIESTAENFEQVVTGALNRMRAGGDVLRFKDGWGLAEHYNESLRSRLTQQDRKQGTKARKRAKRTHGGAPRTGGSGLEARVEAVLRSDEKKEFTTAEIGQVLGLTATHVLGLALGRLAKKHRAEKCGGGKYRAVNGNVQEMPKAV